MQNVNWVNKLSVFFLFVKEAAFCGDEILMIVGNKCVNI